MLTGYCIHIVRAGTLGKLRIFVGLYFLSVYQNFDNVKETLMPDLPRSFYLEQAKKITREADLHFQRFNDSYFGRRLAMQMKEREKRGRKTFRKR